MSHVGSSAADASLDCTCELEGDKSAGEQLQWRLEVVMMVIKACERICHVVGRWINI